MFFTASLIRHLFNWRQKKMNEIWKTIYGPLVLCWYLVNEYGYRCASVGRRKGNSLDWIQGSDWKQHKNKLTHTQTHTDSVAVCVYVRPSCTSSYLNCVHSNVTNNSVMIGIHFLNSYLNVSKAIVYLVFQWRKLRLKLIGWLF